MASSNEKPHETVPLSPPTGPANESSRARLAHARAGQEEPDQILLAEIMGMRNLKLNLFAKASQGPLSVEDIRKMSAYSEAIKEQKAEEFLTQRRRRNSLKTPDKVS
jgi:hypothetical protein